ncbi:hypothetical protein QUF54_05145 [Candidatus Marithioploca araucensis]|uniref:Uncharacterized protein n=1 Tax=Candidatus Marithioploca araucensis TaxID=70273 RepID=A0ABT7VT28_9GAMM|nr:hypothetical protein [Candidatus Marithioploca araucensis]
MDSYKRPKLKRWTPINAKAEALDSYSKVMLDSYSKVMSGGQSPFCATASSLKKCRCTKKTLPTYMATWLKQCLPAGIHQ